VRRAPSFGLGLMAFIASHASAAPGRADPGPAAERCAQTDLADPYRSMWTGQEAKIQVASQLGTLRRGEGGGP